MTPILIDLPKGFYIVNQDDGPELGAGFHFSTRESAERYMNKWLAQYPNPNQRPLHVMEVTTGRDFVDLKDKAVE